MPSAATCSPSPKGERPPFLLPLPQLPRPPLLLQLVPKGWRSQSNREKCKGGTERPVPAVYELCSESLRPWAGPLTWSRGEMLLLPASPATPGELDLRSLLLTPPWD